MNIFRFEIKRNFRTFVIWTVAVAAFVAFMLSTFRSSFGGAAGNLDEYVKMFPEAFRKAFGVDRLDLGTAEGFFGTEVHLMIILFGAMYAALLSTSLLSKEENDRTIEFLLAKPVTRSEVVTQKMLVFLAYTTAFVLVNWVVSLASLRAFSDSAFASGPFWLLGLMTFLSILAIASLGFLGSVFVTRSRAVYSASLGFVLSLYALQIVADVSEKARFLRFITPFKWASAPDILSTAEVVPAYLIAAAAVIALSIAGSYWAYGRKDIAV
ncbi:MAG: ABC transporter permease subunit [Bacillota bacterium]